MNETDLLKKISNAAEKAELQASLFAANEEIPYDYLTLFLGNDDQNRAKTIEITTQKQIIDPTKESKLFRVQFSSKFPFDIAENSSNQTASLIVFLNRFLELPGFEMSEIDDHIFYRYVLLVNEPGFDEELILSIIGNILMILNLYSHALENVSSGKLSYNELLEQALKVSKQVAKK